MKKNMITWIKMFAFLGFFSLFGIIITGCRNDENNNSFYLDEEKFFSEWNSWNNLNIKNYSFTISNGMKRIIDLYNSRSISAPPPQDFIEEWKIIVKNEKMDSFEYTYLTPIFEEYSIIGFNPSNSGYIVNPHFTSISDMYQKLSPEGFYSQLNVKLNVRYDQNYHFIAQFHLCSAGCEGYCNGNTTYIVSDFKILE